MFAREIKRLRAALDDRENDDGNLVKRLRDELNHNNNGRTDLTKSIQDAEREVLFAEFKAKDRDRDVVDLQTRLALHEKESAEKIALLKGEHSAQVALLKEQLEVQRTKIDKIGQIERHAFDVTRENGELKQRINNQGSELAVAHQAAMNKARHNALQLVLLFVFELFCFDLFLFFEFVCF